jgi:hypothetical protein
MSRSRQYDAAPPLRLFEASNHVSLVGIMVNVLRDLDD